MYPIFFLLTCSQTHLQIFREWELKAWIERNLAFIDSEAKYYVFISFIFDQLIIQCSFMMKYCIACEEYIGNMVEKKRERDQTIQANKQ